MKRDTGLVIRRDSPLVTTRGPLGGRKDCRIPRTASFSREQQRHRVIRDDLSENVNLRLSSVEEARASRQPQNEGKNVASLSPVLVFVRFLKRTFNPNSHAISERLLVLEARLEERNCSSRGSNNDPPFPPRSPPFSSVPFFFGCAAACPALAARHGVVKNERATTLPRAPSNFI